MNAVLNVAALENLTAKIRETEAQHQQTMMGLRNQLRAFADSGFTADFSPESAPARRGRKPGSRKPGRPAGSKNAPKADKQSANKDGRKKGEQGLKATIWNTLSAHPEGLSIGELRDTVKKEGTWSSDAANVKQQFSSHVAALKKDGKITRNDDQKYQVVSGASL